MNDPESSDMMKEKKKLNINHIDKLNQAQDQGHKCGGEGKS